MRLAFREKNKGVSNYSKSEWYSTFKFNEIIKDKIIIFDEIQAVPRILLKDFSETISFLSKEFNIDFILMSATIPAIKKYFTTETTCDLLDLKYYSMDFNDRYSLKFLKNIDTVEKLAEQIVKKSKKLKFGVIFFKSIYTHL